MRGADGYEQVFGDVVELHDAFTINTILFLQDLGFCKKGEGGRIVPGDGLSCVHPGMYGLFTMVESTRVLGTEEKNFECRYNIGSDTLASDSRRRFF